MTIDNRQQQTILKCIKIVNHKHTNDDNYHNHEYNGIVGTGSPKEFLSNKRDRDFFSK